LVFDLIKPFFGILREDLDQLSFKKREQNFGSTFFKSTFGKSGSKGGLTGVYPRGGFPKVGFISIYFSKSI
jgi:hypothetical protein